MIRDSLLQLAERCEAATGANQMLDEAIYEALAITPSRDHSFVYPHYAFTASLDAALTLVPEGHIVAVTNCDPDLPAPNFSKASALVASDPDAVTGATLAATMPLALCAAALRARARENA